MGIEVIYADGSRSEFSDTGGSTHDGYIAMERFRLICARSALEVYIRHNGKFEVTRNGARNAINNVIEPITGKTYKRSMKGKREALADCIAIIDAFNESAVVWTD